MPHREALHTVLADLARPQGGPGDRHPSDDDLVAYEAGELAGEDHRRVQDHLVACAECARLVLELSALEPKEIAGEDTVSEFEIEQSLRKLRLRLRPPPVHADHTGWYKALAAGLSVAVLGLASWVGVLHSRGGGPEINDFVWSLSDTSTRGGADQAEAVELPAGSDAVTLLLRASKLGEQDAASYSGFRVEITGTGRTWSRDGLRPLGFNSFSVTLPKKDFPPGSYTIRILGSRNGQAELLAEYALQLRHS